MSKIKNTIEKMGERPILTAFCLLILFGLLVVGFTLSKGNTYKGPFLNNILVEAHGLLFDIIVFGILIVFFNRMGERRRDIKRWHEEIDDYRFWKGEEATHRIAGIVKRLNEQDVTRIELYRCFLERANLRRTSLVGANLRRANLRRANLRGANLKEADLRNANLERANLRSANLEEADLKEAQGLTIEQLSQLKTLFNVKNFDPILKTQIEENYPHLLEEPKDLFKASGGQGS